MESKLDRIIQLLETIVLLLDGEQEADQSQRVVRTLDGEVIVSAGDEETLG